MSDEVHKFWRRASEVPRAEGTERILEPDRSVAGDLGGAQSPAAAGAVRARESLRRGQIPAVSTPIETKICAFFLEAKYGTCFALGKTEIIFVKMARGSM